MSDYVKGNCDVTTMSTNNFNDHMTYNYVIGKNNTVSLQAKYLRTNNTCTNAFNYHKIYLKAAFKIHL